MKTQFKKISFNKFVSLVCVALDQWFDFLKNTDT